MLFKFQGNEAIDVIFTYTCSENNFLNCITFVFRNLLYTFCNPCIQLKIVRNFAAVFVLRDVEMERSAIKCFLKLIKLIFYEIRNDSLSHGVKYV